MIYWDLTGTVPKDEATDVEGIVSGEMTEEDPAL